MVHCPKCRKLTNFTPDNPFRPFCSERCQLLDLGAWASEDYKIPTPENSETSVNDNSEHEEEIH